MTLIQRQWRLFLTAVMFLTRIPVGATRAFERTDFPDATPYFPLVGMGVGLTGAAVLSASAIIFPAAVAILFSMLATVLMTGALHEDGFVDAVEGLTGGLTRERRLEIMKDSRIGTYGALALWFGLTLKFALLFYLLQTSRPWVCAAMIFAHAFSRGGCVILMRFMSYATVSEPKSDAFFNGMRSWHLLPALGFPLALGWALMGPRAIVCGMAGAVIILLCGFYFRKKIGGVTGDCLGATIQLTELSLYMTLLLK